MTKKSKTLAIKEVATKLNVSDRTVQNWIKKGLLTQITIHGNTVRISRSEIHSLMQSEHL